MSDPDRMADDLEMVADTYRHADGALPSNLADHLERAAALLRASPWRPWSELDPEEHGEVLAAWTWGDQDDLPEVHHIYRVNGPPVRWEDGNGDPVLIQPEAWMPIPPLEAEEPEEPTPDIGDGIPEEPPYVVYTDEAGTAHPVHWREPAVWQALYRAVKRGDGDTAERIWGQLPREGRRMHLPGLWGQPETRAWLQEKGVDIEMRWEVDNGD